VARELEYLDEAVVDAEGAARWYAQRSPTAAIRFSVELDAAEAAIIDRPEAWPTVDDGNRHYLLRRFPFSVVYRVEPSRVIIVALLTRGAGPLLETPEATACLTGRCSRRAAGETEVVRESSAPLAAQRRSLGRHQMGPRRLPKTGERLVADLESQLKFLREALLTLPTEPDRYKQLAAGLRVLVCAFGSNRPLLLDLMDEVGVEYMISPLPDLPFPITMVDEIDEEPTTDLSSMTPDQIWAYHRSRGKSYGLREFVLRALAVYVLGHAYSYAALIRTLAEQSGLGHEDWTVDQNMVELESFIIGGFQGHVAPLRSLAEHVLAAGIDVVNKAASMGYRPQYLLAVEGRYRLPPIRDVA
jgi:plasmid stabilization system protein ParE